MVRKVVKLVTVLTPFLEFVEAYHLRFFAQKRKCGNEEDREYFIHDKLVVLNFGKNVYMLFFDLNYTLDSKTVL